MSTPPPQLYKDDLQQITLVPEPESNTKASPINMDELLINVNKDSDEEEEYDSNDDGDGDGDDDVDWRSFPRVGESFR
jgi:hypothetical protein